MIFQAEPVTYELLEEALPLLHDHYKEISLYQDLPLEPNFEAYLTMADQGILRLFTSRIPGELVGYALYVVMKHHHYQSAIFAGCDVIYIKPDHRGEGHRFIAWCDAQLSAEGVEAVTYNASVKHDFGPMLKRMGFQHSEQVYTRRLVRPVSMTESVYTESASEAR